MDTNPAGRVPPQQALTFGCFTQAEPSRVWSALTDAAQTRAYLYGLAAHSTWLADADINIQTEHSTLTGRVLCAIPDERLSYMLQAGPLDPPVYLTWLIRQHPGGCTIRLQVDEIESADCLEVAEDTWLPVLAGLQRLLAQPC
jgi:uncharacterized protein YndB with AHSA1/START domain